MLLLCRARLSRCFVQPQTIIVRIVVILYTQSAVHPNLQKVSVRYSRSEWYLLYTYTNDNRAIHHTAGCQPPSYTISQFRQFIIRMFCVFYSFTYAIAYIFFITIYTELAVLCLIRQTVFWEYVYRALTLGIIKNWLSYTYVRCDVIIFVIFGIVLLHN